MLIVDASGNPIVNSNGDLTGETTPNVSDASACTTRSVNAAWYAGAAGSAEIDMKTALRRGDARVLNVYFADLLAEGLLGYAYYPTVYASNKYLDGVVVADAVIVGGSLGAFNEGVSRFRKKKQS
jgi:hypothetical protein